MLFDINRSPRYLNGGKHPANYGRKRTYMGKNKLWDSVSVFETGLSAAEWVWRIVTFLFIVSGGTATAFLAKADPLLKELGPIYWVAIGFITSLALSVIFYLFKSANLKQAQADFHRVMATPRTSINPLAESFKDLIISVEDLRLPTSQLHEGKHFKRCKFVGPAALAILGGTYKNSNFLECGDIVALPENTNMTGIIVLKSCTVEECEFIRTSIFTDQNTAKGFATIPGAMVKGIA
ncbi:MAG: hypothetical protein WA157_05245 [Rhodoferax ferrireducens]